MIVLTANMWPRGDARMSYELLHAVIDNRTGPEDGANERYAAHVLSRPQKYLNIVGYEADVEVKGHRRSDGPASLILAVLHEANGFERTLPDARLLSRITIEDAAAFEQRLRERT